jgi:type I restriction enzyme S subunit
MSVWVEKSLNELGVLARGKSRHRPRNAEFLYGGQYPFVQTSDVKNANFYLTEYSQTYSEAGLKQSKLWKKGTLCITIAANIADTSILGIDACFPDSILGFTPFENVSDVKFIKYSFDLLQRKIKQISQGAAQDNLSMEKLNTVKFLVPDYKTQHRIGSILSAYDDLIENNLKQIKLLEEIAQRTYEEWFVKFRVNGEQLPFDEKTGLPVGWSMVQLENLISFQKGKKATEIVTEYKEGYLKLLLLDGIESGKYPYTNSSNQVITDKDDLLMLMDGARSSKVFFADKGVVGSTLSKITIKNEYLSSSLLKLFFDTNYELMQTNNTGAAIPHANKSFINGMLFPLPINEVLIKWKEIVEIQYKQIQSLKSQNQKLKESRDILLPKLMNCTINV